jgi:hypothetical protein
MPIGIIERAYTLARSGKYQELEEIRSVLDHEGFENVASHLASPSVRQDIRRIFVENKQRLEGPAIDRS